MLPQTCNFHEFVSWYANHYLPSQRELVDRNGESLFSITPESIFQALKNNPPISLHPFLVDWMMEIYHKLTFQQRASMFDSFMLEGSELPFHNPPYSSTTFPKMPK